MTFRTDVAQLSEYLTRDSAVAGIAFQTVQRQSVDHFVQVLYVFGC